jgi:hypothetical protein
MAYTAEYLLPGCKRTVRLVMPNLYAVVSKVGGIPSPALAAVLKLLNGENLLQTPNEAQRMVNAAANIRGLYEIAALCLDEPKLVLDGPVSERCLGPDEIPLGDLEVIYWRFFRAGIRESPTAVAPVNPGGTADTPPAGDDLSQPAE